LVYFIHFPQHLNATRPGPQPNILLVSVDALRADAEGSALTPNLNALAGQSVWFPRAYAQGSRTTIAMSALMLGRYSANIQWDLWVYADDLYRPQDFSAADRARLKGRFEQTTVPRFRRGDRLAERLKAAGYRTVAVPYARGVNVFRPGVGLEVGFDEYETFADDDGTLPSSPRVTERALATLGSPDGARPWFLWVHYFDPHESRGDLDDYARLVKAFDGALGGLLAGVEVRDGGRPTVVALVADHGEAFGEHRGGQHGTSLYDEQIRVPMGLRVPGVAPRREGRAVAALDLTATLAVLGRAATEGFDGLNLLALAEGGGARRPIFSELHQYRSQDGGRTADLKAVIVGHEKLILDRRTGGAELYDLEADPAEANNLLTYTEPKERGRYVPLRGMIRSLLSDPERSRPLP
jgi:arylsulfatase A-like enzyme